MWYRIQNFSDFTEVVLYVCHTLSNTPSGIWGSFTWSDAFVFLLYALCISTANGTKAIKSLTSVQIKHYARWRKIWFLDFSWISGLQIRDSEPALPVPSLLPWWVGVGADILRKSLFFQGGRRSIQMGVVQGSALWPLGASPEFYLTIISIIKVMPCHFKINQTKWMLKHCEHLLYPPHSPTCLPSVYLEPF